MASGGPRKRPSVFETCALSQQLMAGARGRLQVQRGSRAPSSHAPSECSVSPTNRGLVGRTHASSGSMARQSRTFMHHKEMLELTKKTDALEDALAVLKERGRIEAEAAHAAQQQLHEEIKRLNDEKASLTAKAGRASALEQRVRQAYTEMEALAEVALGQRMPEDRLAKEHPHALLDYMKVHLRLCVMRLEDRVAVMEGEVGRMTALEAQSAQTVNRYAEDIAAERQGMDDEHEALGRMKAELEANVEVLKADHDEALRVLRQDKRDMEFENEKLKADVLGLQRALQQRTAQREEAQTYERKIKALEDEIAKMQSSWQVEIEAGKCTLHGRLIKQDERMTKERVLRARAEERVERLTRANKNLQQSSVALKTGKLPKEIAQGKAMLSQDALEAIHGKTGEKMMALKKLNAELKAEADKLKRQLKQARLKNDEMKARYQNLYAMNLLQQENRERARAFAKFQPGGAAGGGDGERGGGSGGDGGTGSTEPDSQDIMLEYYRAKVQEVQHESKVLSRHVKKSVLQEQREKQTFQKERAHFESEMRRMQEEVEAMRRGIDKERESWQLAVRRTATKASDADYKTVMDKADAVTSPYRKGDRDPMLTQVRITADAVAVQSPYMYETGVRENDAPGREVSTRTVDAERGYRSPFTVSYRGALLRRASPQRAAAALLRPVSASPSRSDSQTPPADAPPKDVSRVDDTTFGDDPSAPIGLDDIELESPMPAKMAQKERMA